MQLLFDLHECDNAVPNGGSLCGGNKLQGWFDDVWGKVRVRSREEKKEEIHGS